MADNPQTRCMRCEAPIPFSPGAGSRLCPFCGAVNLVREQLIAAPPIELKIDDIFRQFQNGHMQAALDQANRLSESLSDNFRLFFYRACILLAADQLEDAIYALIDLTGMDAPAHLRADAQAKLAEALLRADRVEEAFQATERCLELQDGHPAGCLVMAGAMARQGKREEALKLTQDTLRRLDRPWRITFPPQRHELLMQMAEIHVQLDNHAEAATALEDLILTDSAAPIRALQRAVHLLSRNYLEHAINSTSAVELLRLGALLDPENRHGLLTDLKVAAERIGTDFAQELEAFKQVREELLSEIRSALGQAKGDQSIKPELVTPQLDLTMLNPDPDKRTDMLERAAERMQLTHFDRGTLYPLQSIEDFRRWLVRWRLRDQVSKLRRNKVELERLLKLKEARVQTDRPGRKGAGGRGTAGAGGRRRRWLAWVVGLLSFALIGGGVFMVMAGDRFLDSFEGTLIKVDCLGEGGTHPCTLHVATGEQGRRRFRSRELAEGWLSKLWRRWLDHRAQADGTLLYPMSFPWANLDPDTYRACVGKPIAKMRFTLAPICSTIPK